MSEYRWYLQSYKDAGAHWGQVNTDGTVTARCGLIFQPQARLVGDGPAVVDTPAPLQACPDCQASRFGRKPVDFWEHGSVG